MERLKVSYAALDNDEKEIFLDIACFFTGERRSSAIIVWDGSGWSGLYSWENLHNKCLVEVDRIRMHDHLRDLGREIAKTHSPSRFWFQRQKGNANSGVMTANSRAIFRFLEAMIDHKQELHLSPPPFKEYMGR
ncbi:hypothetical protein SUGI_0684070 [Cryptomeria japonica]|nr:hypothetical protein SUGI_0684070 [Cryptomeria japonica]